MQEVPVLDSRHTINSRKRASSKRTEPHNGVTLQELDRTNLQVDEKIESMPRRHKETKVHNPRICSTVNSSHSFPFQQSTQSSVGSPPSNRRSLGDMLATIKHMSKNNLHVLLQARLMGSQTHLIKFVLKRLEPFLRTAEMQGQGCVRSFVTETSGIPSASRRACTLTDWAKVKGTIVNIH